MLLLCCLAGNALCAGALSPLEHSKLFAGTMSTSPSVPPVKGETLTPKSCLSTKSVLITLALLLKGLNS